MPLCSSPRITAADVADAVFCSIILGTKADDEQLSQRTETAMMLESIQMGLQAAGISFAEYLERMRCAREPSAQESSRRWRYSARERAIQRVDSTVTLLCDKMKASVAGIQ